MKKLLLALGGILLISSPAEAITWGEFWEPFTDNDTTHVHVQRHTYKSRRYHHQGSHNHCHSHYDRGYSHCHRHGRNHHGGHRYDRHYYDGHGGQIIIR